MSSVLQVFVFRSGQYVGSEIFTEPEIMIGRGPDADLHVDEDGVATNHAILNNKEGQATLLDLGAAGGTRVNRVPIQHCYVTARDEISIGSYSFKIKFVQAAQPSPPAPAPAPAVAPSTSAPSTAGGLDAIISDSLTPAQTKPEAATDFEDVLGGDVIASVESPPPPEERAFGNLDDALASAFLSPEAPSSPPFEPPVAPAAPVSLAPEESLPSDPAGPTPDLRGLEPVPASTEPSLDQALVRPLEMDPSPPLSTDVPLASKFLSPPESSADLFVPNEDELSDEELDELTPPGFSLVESLIREGAGKPGRRAVEVLIFTPHSVQTASLLQNKGQRLVLGRRFGSDMIPEVGRKGLPLVKFVEDGRAEITLPDEAQGFVTRSHDRVPIEQLRAQAKPAPRAQNAKRLELRSGSQLTLSMDDHGVLVRFVDPPHLADEKSAFKVDKKVRNSFGGAVVVHLMAGLIVGLSAEGVVYSDPMTEEWTEIPQEDVRDVEIEEPEPEPEVVEEPEPEPEPEPDPEPQKEPPPPPKRDKRPTPKPSKRAPKGVSKQKVKNAGVLGAMGKLNLAAPGKKSMVQAVSNIDAVKTPGGSNYRVGALVGKTPSSKVSVGGGGGGKLLTRGSAQLLKGGSGFARIGKKGGSAKVRGRVAKASSRRVQAKGSLPREAIIKVINEHLREVQYCYEKNLLKDPSLKGKLHVEWTIATSGSVSRVRQKSSTLRSPEVASCIMQSIKRWRFPRPSGGVVVVSYPFIFSQTSF